MLSSTATSIHWRPARQWTSRQIPLQWRHCLLDQGSLTRRLMDASEERFSVRVVRETVMTPRPDERRSLGLPPRRRAFLREVLLVVDGSPRVFARSIIPLATMKGRLRALRRLDDRPLGALLFADPTMARGPLEIARIPASCIPAGLADPGEMLWGRRSVFYLEGRPLLVSEIFLSARKP